MDRVRANGMNLREGRRNDQGRCPVDDNRLARHTEQMQEMNKHGGDSESRAKSLL